MSNGWSAVENPGYKLASRNRHYLFQDTAKNTIKANNNDSKEKLVFHSVSRVFTGF